MPIFKLIPIESVIITNKLRLAAISPMDDHTISVSAYRKSDLLKLICTAIEIKDDVIILINPYILTDDGIQHLTHI